MESGLSKEQLAKVLLVYLSNSYEKHERSPKSDCPDTVPRNFWNAVQCNGWDESTGQAIILHYLDVAYAPQGLENTDQISPFPPMQADRTQDFPPGDYLQSGPPTHVSPTIPPHTSSRKRKRSCPATSSPTSTLFSSASSEKLSQNESKPVAKGIELVCTCHACQKTIKGLGNMKVHLSICGRFGERKKWTCTKCPNKVYYQEQFYKKHHHDKHREACLVKSSTFCSHADNAREDVDPPKLARGCGVCGEHVPTREYLLSHVTQHYKETRGTVAWTQSNEFLGLLRQPVVAGGETLLAAMAPCTARNKIKQKELELVAWDREHMTALHKKLQGGVNGLNASDIDTLVLEIFRAGGFNVEATPELVSEERPELARSSVPDLMSSSVPRQLESSVHQIEEQARHRAFSASDALSLHGTSNLYLSDLTPQADFGFLTQSTYMSDEIWSFDPFAQPHPGLATSFELSTYELPQRSINFDVPCDQNFDMESTIMVSGPGLTPLPSFDWPLG